MRPVIRYFVACWNRTPGTPALQYRIGDIRTLLYLGPEEQYPAEREICFVAFLAGVREPGQVQIRQRIELGLDESVVWQSKPITLDLAPDPLTVRFVPIRADNVPFPKPGQYEFVLLWNGIELDPPIYLEARA